MWVSSLGSPDIPSVKRDTSRSKKTASICLSKKGSSLLARLSALSASCHSRRLLMRWSADCYNSSWSHLYYAATYSGLHAVALDLLISSKLLEDLISTTRLLPIQKKAVFLSIKWLKNASPSVIQFCMLLNHPETFTSFNTQQQKACESFFFIKGPPQSSQLVFIWYKRRRAGQMMVPKSLVGFFPIINTSDFYYYY